MIAKRVESEIKEFSVMFLPQPLLILSFFHTTGKKEKEDEIQILFYSDPNKKERGTFFIGSDKNWMVGYKLSLNSNLNVPH